MSENTDDRLVTDAKNGDTGAFKELVERHEGRVAGVVKSMLGDQPEAIDVGQEVFIRFYESLDKFRGESSVSTYLIRIAINLSLNELKKRKRKNIFLRPIEKRDEDETAHEITDLKEIIHHEISRLEPDFQSVIILRMIEGYSTEETAEIIGIPIGTVLSRLSRAQNKLRTALTKRLNT